MCALGAVRGKRTLTANVQKSTARRASTAVALQHQQQLVQFLDGGGERCRVVAVPLLKHADADQHSLDVLADLDRDDADSVPLPGSVSLLAEGGRRAH